MTTRTIPAKAQWLVIHTTKGKMFLCVNDMIVMTSDYIFRKDIHPQQLNPWIARDETSGLDTMTIHPAALVKMLVKLENEKCAFHYINSSIINHTKHSYLTIQEKDLQEAVHKIKNQ